MNRLIALSLFFIFLSSCGAAPEQNISPNQQSTDKQDNKPDSKDQNLPNESRKPFKAKLTIQDNAQTCIGTLCQLHSATLYSLNFFPDKDSRILYVDSQAKVLLKTHRNYTAALKFSEIPFPTGDQLETDIHVIIDESSDVQLNGFNETAYSSKDGTHSIVFNFSLSEISKAKILEKAPKQLHLHFGFYKEQIGYPFLSVSIPMQFEEEES